MPVTPFHFGPASILKAATPQSFSFVAFGLTQIIIDLEPLFYMAQGQWPIHRFFHTYLGATIVALLVAYAGKPLREWLLRFWNGRLSASQRIWLGVDHRVLMTAAMTGALFGGFSHILLDSVMHSDIRPFAPFSNDNGLLYAISIEQLYILCAISGIVGGVLLVIVLMKRKRAAGKSR